MARSTCSAATVSASLFYHDYDELRAELSRLAAENADVASVFSIGRSHQEPCRLDRVRLVRLVLKHQPRLVLLAEPEKPIGPDLLSDYISLRTRSSSRQDGNLKTAIQQLEDQMIREAMEKTNSNKSRAARLLGISRQSLIEKLKKAPLSKK